MKIRMPITKTTGKALLIIALIIAAAWYAGTDVTVTVESPVVAVDGGEALPAAVTPVTALAAKVDVLAGGVDELAAEVSEVTK